MNGRACIIFLFVFDITYKLKYKNKYKKCLVDDVLIQRTPLVHYLLSTLNFPMQNKSEHYGLRVFFLLIEERFIMQFYSQECNNVAVYLGCS